MVKIFDQISHLPEFNRDFKRLLKRYKTLEEDLRVFIEKQLNLYHKLKIDNKGIFPITGTGIENPRIYKAKKFACRSIKGKGVKSGIRIIYAYHKKEDIVEFIEIYHKNDKESEDRERINKYCTGKEP